MLRSTSRKIPANPSSVGQLRAAQRALAVAFGLCALCAHADPLPMPSGVTYESGFSPGHAALDVVLHGIESAQKQIFVAAYSFTSKPVATALVAAHKRGIKVFVVADNEQNTKAYTSVTFLANEGVPVRLNSHYAAMHSKFMVIDNTSVQLGSFNYSGAATERNEENALLLRDVAPLAQQYAVEWKRLWDEGSPLRSAY